MFEKKFHDQGKKIANFKHKILINWEFIVTSDVKQNKREIESVERKTKGIFIRKRVLSET